MVVLPLAVTLVSLVVLFVCLGLLHAAQAVLAPILYGIADLLGGIPYVGRKVEGWADETIGLVLHWLGEAAAAVGVSIHRLWAWTAHEISWLGREIEGLALDAFAAIRNLILHTIPRWVGRAERATARLFSFLWRQARNDLGWLWRQLRAAERRAVDYAESVAAGLRRHIAAALGDAWSFIHGGIRWLTHLVTVTIPRDVGALEHRVGGLERYVVGYVERELRRLWRELNPLRLFEEFVRWLWAQIPDGVKTFLAWIWSLLVRFEGFVVDVAEGRWPPPIHHTHGQAYMRRTAQDAATLDPALRDVLGVPPHV